MSIVRSLGSIFLLSHLRILRVQVLFFGPAGWGPYGPLILYTRFDAHGMALHTHANERFVFT